MTLIITGRTTADFYVGGWPILLPAISDCMHGCRIGLELNLLPQYTVDGRITTHSLTFYYYTQTHIHQQYIIYCPKPGANAKLNL